MYFNQVLIGDIDKDEEEEIFGKFLCSKLWDLFFWKFYFSLKYCYKIILYFCCEEIVFVIIFFGEFFFKFYVELILVNNLSKRRERWRGNSKGGRGLQFNIYFYSIFQGTFAIRVFLYLDYV